MSLPLPRTFLHSHNKAQDEPYHKCECTITHIPIKALQNWLPKENILRIFPKPFVPNSYLLFIHCYKIGLLRKTFLNLPKTQYTYTSTHIYPYKIGFQRKTFKEFSQNPNITKVELPIANHYHISDHFFRSPSSLLHSFWVI